MLQVKSLLKPDGIFIASFFGEENLSELVIGGIDFNRIQGEIYFFEVISRKYWEVKITRLMELLVLIISLIS